ncbi:MAG: integrase [delta proteobacterium MLS_D]|jgi:integrase|nr:MAG: integrase [delta proteobacterium MLS_D]
MTLTDKAVINLKPKGNRYEVLDRGGLYVRVMPSGTKSWIYRYMIDGTARRMTLGRYPAVSLAEAREKHAMAGRDVDRGVDPGAKAQERKTKRREEYTFADMIEEYWTEELSKTPTGKERLRLVAKDALPRWKKRKISDITRRDGVLLIRGVRERAPVAANRLLGVLVRAFNFACEEGLLTTNPLVGMRRFEESARSRVLNDEEIKLLWKGLDLGNEDIDIFHVVKLAAKAILLTGQRPGEVASMSWDHVEGDWWVIPADQRKNREENRVPIMPLFREVIETARAYSSTSYVFASPRNDSLPLTRAAISAAIRRHFQEMGVEEQFTPHDLRRTFRTRLAELGVTDIVAERCLGHKLGGILAVYNRHDYFAEKRQAFEAWERRLREILGLEPIESKILSMGDYRHG